MLFTAGLTCEVGQAAIPCVLCYFRCLFYVTGRSFFSIAIDPSYFTLFSSTLYSVVHEADPERAITMSPGTHIGGLRSSTTWAFFVVFALIILTRNVAYADICNYDGGWSMRRESSCSTIASKRCSSTWDGSQVLCCPDDYVCSGEDDFENQYCCKG